MAEQTGIEWCDATSSLASVVCPTCGHALGAHLREVDGRIEPAPCDLCGCNDGSLFTSEEFPASAAVPA